MHSPCGPLPVTLKMPLHSGIELALVIALIWKRPIDQAVPSVHLSVLLVALALPPPLSILQILDISVALALKQELVRLATEQAPVVTVSQTFLATVILPGAAVGGAAVGAGIPGKLLILTNSGLMM